MKRLSIFIMAGVMISLAACQKNFIDISPTANFTDAVYFKQPGDFKTFAT